MTTTLAGIGTLVHLALVAMLQAQGGGSAPRAVTIPYRVSCSTCRIDISQIATLAPHGLDAPSGNLGGGLAYSTIADADDIRTLIVYRVDVRRP